MHEKILTGEPGAKDILRPPVFNDPCYLKSIHQV